MGQYHFVANLDKRQFLHPHKLGDGLKLLEFGDSSSGTMTALALLLACACKGGGRGGGDPRETSPLIGSWAGDRVAIVGDYAEKSDLPEEYGADTLFERIETEYEDISDQMVPILEAECDVKIIGTGWREKTPNKMVLKPDMIIRGAV